MVELNTILLNGIEIITLIVGGATLLFRGVLLIAQVTKTDKDNVFCQKVLDVLSVLALNVGVIKNYINVKKQ